MIRTGLSDESRTASAARESSRKAEYFVSPAVLASHNGVEAEQGRACSGRSVSASRGAAVGVFSGRRSVRNPDFLASVFTAASAQDPTTWRWAQ